MNLQKYLADAEHSVVVANRKIPKIVSYFDSLQIHEWRVNVKRVRSLMRIARTSPKCTERLQLPGSTKRVFQLLGKIRDGQVVREKIMDMAWTTFPDSRAQFMTSVNGEIVLHERALRKMAKHWKTHLRQLRHFNRTQNEYLTPAVIRNFIGESFKELNHLVSQVAPTDEQIHRMRSVVKDLLCNWFLGQRCNVPGSLTGELKTSFQTISLQTGDYLDSKIAILFLENFMRENKRLPYHDENAVLLKNWLLQAEDLRKQILVSFSNIRPLLQPISNDAKLNLKIEMVHRRAIVI